MLNAPDPEIDRLLDEARRAYAGGDRAGATVLARQVLLRQAGEARALQILGVVALDAGDASTARRHLEASNAAQPDATTLNMIGVAAGRLGDTDVARAAFTRAGELGLVDGWRNLAVIEKGQARIAAYQRALKLAPNDAASHAGLAQALENRHDVDAAKQHANTALRIDPANATARLALARVLVHEKDFAGVEATLAPVAQAPRTPPEQRVLALGLIGDARDRRDDARGAFQAFTAANQLSLQLNGSWLTATERLYHPDNVRRMAECVDKLDATASPMPPEARAPAFLVGFPRSGTTLLDQVLSSHSRIVCLEESEHLSDALSEVIADASRATRPDLLSEQDVARIRDSYWRRIESSSNAIVVDKYPLNIVILPLIKRVFPNAKIIFALRDPRDVVLSCFQQRFTINAAMVQFLDLERAGAYYDQVMSLFALCQARLDLDLYQLRYEDLVADLEAVARGVSDFLGAGFEAEMLNYRKTALKRDIATPSARQVIEPLYNRSVGRWRRYEEELGPVLPVLAPWAERYGYPP